METGALTLPEPRRVTLLSGDSMLGLAPPIAVIEAVRRAAIVMAEGGLQAPPREHLEAAGSTLLVMPSATSAQFGTKLVSINPGNPEHGLPSTQGLMLLFDAATGAPTAIMDAAALTCQRTGAVAALAIQQMSGESLDAIGLVGCGVQGAWTAIMAAAIRPLKTVHVLARSAASYDRFVATLHSHAPQLEVRPCPDAASLLARCDCVVTATTSATPVLPDDEALLAGKLFVSIGSYRPHMQELPDAVYRLAGAVVTDSPQAAHEVGDLINPLREGWVAPAAVFALADVLTRTASLGPTQVFKSVGHAAYDLFVADLLHTTAHERGMGQVMSF